MYNYISEAGLRLIFVDSWIHKILCNDTYLYLDNMLITSS